jgi:crossover junction endodeoxyribonuclease RuvC
MTAPIFVGMDPSYNGFAIVIIDKDAEIVDQILLKSKTKDEAEDRIIALEKGFSFVADLIGRENVYIEGPSFSSSGAFMLQMGALHYYLRIFFRKNNVNFKVITPNGLKKFVTGKGTAKKELMLLKVYKKWGVEFDDNNLCDAYGMARMALEEYNNDK